MADDAQLLRQFVENRSEPAFAELVQRHLALVYHTAARQLGGDSHLAQDVAQSVFILLAEKSPSLTGHPSIVGWLHATTHFKVSELRRVEHRRRLREDAAQTRGELMNDPTSKAEWDRMRPVIDEALLELNASDREAVLLRFFENRPFAEIGARLRLTEKTAHKRVERALEKLRVRLQRRGLTSSAAALATLLAGQSALAVPAGLASSVTGAVAVSGLPAAATLGTLSTIMSTKSVVVAVAIAGLLTSGATTYYEVNSTRDLAAVLADATQKNEMLAAQLRAERARASQMTRQAPSVTSPSATPIPPVTPQSAESEDFPTIEEGRALLKANPAFREAFVAKSRAQITSEYAGLIASLGLTDAELEQFVTLLMNSQTAAVGRHQITLHDETFTDAEFTRQLHELLGDARYEQHREFVRYRPARNLTNDLTRSLYFTAQPLTKSQADQMQRLVVQTISNPANRPQDISKVDHTAPVPGWDLLLAQASSVLTEPQMDALRDIHERAKFTWAQGFARRSYDNPPVR